MYRLPLAPVLVVLSLFGCTGEKTSHDLIDQLGVVIEAGDNRPFSYTDKTSAYFYGMTHTQLFDDYFAGWNVQTQKIFGDYELSVNGRPLQRATTTVKVYPDRLVREHEIGTERLQLFDRHTLVAVYFHGEVGDTLGLSLNGHGIQLDRSTPDEAFFVPVEGGVVVVAPVNRVPVRLVEDEEGHWVNAVGDGFFISHAADDLAALKLVEDGRQNHADWAAGRRARMHELVAEDNYLSGHDAYLVEAIHWARLTLDQLVTRQTGDGIYAGLPWFNDYWGRDIFISLPGATLVSGQFDVARNILTSFAAFQNTDPESADYGRVPNRLRPDDVIYNTTDGTPRFVIALMDYVRYSGDLSIIHELFPAVRRSIEGPLRHWTDDKGYLRHSDADTWMDARKDGRTPWSPRGDRANDIQALWFAQLEAGAFMARFLGHDREADEWSEVAARLKRSFEADFSHSEHEHLADRLRPDGSADFSMRPNQLFALGLIEDPARRAEITGSVWNELVFPWGVASLSQDHPNFHAFHENPEFYHKDAAYHNGTVWVWNNGIAMQRMIELGRKDLAWRLFEHMTREVHAGGAVGSLPENMDAIPRPGQKWPNRSGTFLQAWSNAEYLRIWHEYFLGLRPDAVRKLLVFAPRLPTQIDSLDYKQRVLDGKLSISHRRTGNRRTAQIESVDVTTRLHVDVPPFSTFDIELDRNGIIRLDWSRDSLVAFRSKRSRSPLEKILILEPDSARIRLLESLRRKLNSVDFATPREVSEFPTLLKSSQ